MDAIPVFGSRVDGCPYVVRPSAYGLIRNAAGAFAVVRTAKGGFLPGGGIETGESIEDAVRREAREECGLIVQPGALIGHAVEIVHSLDENTCFEKRCAFLEADLQGSVADGEPDHELLWLDRDRAIEALAHESQRWAVRRSGERRG